MQHMNVSIQKKQERDAVGRTDEQLVHSLHFTDISNLFCSHSWYFCNQRTRLSHYPSVIVTYWEMLEMILSVSSWAFPIIPFTKSIVPFNSDVVMIVSFFTTEIEMNLT